MVNLYDSIFTANLGGGIQNLGAMQIEGCLISENVSGELNGAGINNAGTMVVKSSTIDGNIKFLSGGGGGIGNSGTMTIIDSSITDNKCDCHYGCDGGGIYNDGQMIIINSTVSGNIIDDVPGHGGGIYSNGDLQIINSTITANGAVPGGGIYRSSGNVVLSNTIVANSYGYDCYGEIIDGGHNISSDDSCGFDPANGSMPNTDPLLGPLQNNGGPTWTHALLEGSPAIDVGDDTQCPETDQRGISRPYDGDGDGEAVCDMGSYEYNPGQLIVTTLEDELNTDGDCSLREAVEAANTNTSVDVCGTGYVLTDTITFEVEGTILVSSQLSVTAGGPLVVDGDGVHHRQRRDGDARVVDGVRECTDPAISDGERGC